MAPPGAIPDSHLLHRMLAVASSITITSYEVHDLRFPTSASQDGSDAMHTDPDYSAAYVVLQTSSPALSGCGMTFTIGRGNELCVAAIRPLAEMLTGVRVDQLMQNPAALYRKLTSDSQLRWLGPEKGVIHLATAAVINAVWDLWARMVRKPVWQLVCEMSADEIVACIDFRYLTNAVTPDQARELLARQEPGRSERIALLRDRGCPSYTTSAGWLGYSDDELRARCADLRERGWRHFKIKVGRNHDDDMRRCRVLRDAMGESGLLMVDANQIWEVAQAIEWIRTLAPFRPWFVEEPTSPDDVLGHAEIAKAVAPIRIATGEMCHNRMMFKQFMQAGAMQVCQLDTCRLGGVNEVLAVLLLAARFDVPVCPHAGGVGLCEYVQHASMVDYVCFSGTQQDRLTEYSDHLHEHLCDPVRMEDGHYMPPVAPGYGVKFTEAAISAYSHQPR